MKNILVFYSTLTGTTAEIATELHKRLTAEIPDDQFELGSVRDISTDKLSSYDLILFGNPTWDHGIPSPDCEVFLEDLDRDQVDLANAKFAQFGLGDSSYSEFCGALPLIKEDLERHGAKVDTNEFTMDGYPGEATLVELVDWAKKRIADV